jgi:hypothetical protein
VKIANKDLLVTSSLLDSFAWYKEAPNKPSRDNEAVTWKQKALTDLRHTLTRAPYTSSFEADRGTAFESKIYPSLFLPREAFVAKHGETLGLFHDLCAGGRQQETLKAKINVDGQNYTLYGKSDVLYPIGSKQFPEGKIIDIKTTLEWKGHSKYTARVQHPMYIVMSGIETFVYLVAVGEDGKEPKDFTVTSVFPVEASLDFETANAIMVERIRAFMAFLAENPELQDAYCNVFTKSW